MNLSSISSTSFFGVGPEQGNQVVTLVEVVSAQYDIWLFAQKMMIFCYGILSCSIQKGRKEDTQLCAGCRNKILHPLSLAKL